MSIAHKLKDKVRTGDVLISEEIDFSSLLLSDCVIRGLQDCGFERPSPIQLKAIPLGRCGLDLIVQAKSGTGKTCVFSVIALESIQVQSSAIQVLVLAPTREIAIQIWEVIKSIGGAMPALRCHTFIGGLPLSEDKQNLKKCHIAVGSPGRIKQLIENGVLKTDSIRLFVLDEADKLLEESFQEQINWIYSALPDNKQMLALSATYPEYLAQHLTRYMRNPTFMRLNITDPALLGIRQYYKSVEFSPMVKVTFERKTAAVVDLLSGVSFQQCLIFSNLQTRAQNLSEELQSRGWPTACIAGCLDQRDRIEAMSRLKTYKCRILISTDLTSRGIDADKVNLVINLDVPPDHETYLHRIGRAGRFGSFGGAVSVVSSGQEEGELRAVERKCNTHIVQLPDPLPVDLLKTTAMVKLDDVVSTEQLITRTPDSHDLIAANQPSEPSVSRQNLAEVSAGNDDHELAEMGNGEDKSSGKEGQISNGQATHSNGFPQNGMGQQKTQDEDLHNGLLQLNGNGSDEQHENKSGRDKLKSELQELSVGSQSEAGVSESMKCKLEDKIIRATLNKPEEEQDKTVSNGNRPIAKAKRKRKAEDRPKAHQSECSSKEIPTSVEVPVCVEMHRGGETASSRLVSDLADRVKAKQQARPELTLPSMRDRFGCRVLQRPYSYTSALVDYERFLEEASSREDQIDTGQLIMDKIDLERKTSVDKDLIASVNDCIDKMYACVLAANTQVDCCDVKDETKSSIEEPTLPVSGLCVQKCSKSTQTSHQTRTNNNPRAVRYHPMSVSSLGLCMQGQDTQLESKSNLSDEISNWTHSDILDKEPKKESCVEDTSTDQNIAMSTVVEECETGNQAGNKDTSDRLVESPMKSVLSCDQARQDCELMYVSERVGTVSLTPHTVTVEPGLLHSLDVRPKSRKGKHTADLHGYEYGRIHGKNNPRTVYKLNNREDYDTSSSESESSSSSEYEKEVFCNNYFEEPMGNRRKKSPKTEYKRHTKSSKNCSNEENIYDSSSRSEPYSQWYDWYNSPGAETLNYPPWYVTPSGYYPPYSYMYPHPSAPYPQHPYWHPSLYPQAPSYGVGQCWGDGSGGERERIKAMRRTMELQRLYIRKMAKSTS